MSDFEIENDANIAHEETYIMTEQDFVSMMIEMYRKRPVLWKAKHPQYCDRQARAAAVQEIVEELKQYKEDFSESELKKRLNVLRTNFNKIRQGRRRPSVWYYQQMLFLAEQDSNSEEFQVNEGDVTLEVIDPDLESNNANGSTEVDTYGVVEESNVEEVETTEHEEKFRPRISVVRTEPERKKPRIITVPTRPRTQIYLKNNIATLTPKPSTSQSYAKKNIHLKREITDEDTQEREEHPKCNDSGLEQYMTVTTTYYRKPKTNEDFLAESWARSLKTATPAQKMFAEKIINDVLLQAQLGNLTQDVFLSIHQ